MVVLVNSARVPGTRRSRAQQRPREHDGVEELLPALHFGDVAVSRSAELVSHKIGLHAVGASGVLNPILKAVPQRVDCVVI